jgi:hypothetical protein
MICSYFYFGLLLVVCSVPMTYNILRSCRSCYVMFCPVMCCTVLCCDVLYIIYNVLCCFVLAPPPPPPPPLQVPRGGVAPGTDGSLPGQAGRRSPHLRAAGCGSGHPGRGGGRGEAVRSFTHLLTQSLTHSSLTQSPTHHLT